jgi:hypothetical protein
LRQKPSAGQTLVGSEHHLREGSDYCPIFPALAKKPQRCRRVDNHLIWIIFL